MDAKVLNSKYHGTPHNRGRLYIVGRMHHGEQLERLSWSEPIPVIPMKHFLDEPDPSCDLKSARPNKSAKHAVSQVLASYKAMIAAGIHPFKSDCICDIDSSNINWQLDCSPCLTHARSRGHWVSSRGRRQTINERLRLMGMNPNWTKS